MTVRTRTIEWMTQAGQVHTRQFRRLFAALVLLDRLADDPGVVYAVIRPIRRGRCKVN